MRRSVLGGEIIKERNSDAEEDHIPLIIQEGQVLSSLPSTNVVRRHAPSNIPSAASSTTSLNSASERSRPVDFNVGLNKDGSRIVSLATSEKPSIGTYPPNVVCNQKYTLLTFIPVALYEQFKFFFNLYFLLVALSQFIPALKIGYLFTYVGPLCFVLFITLGKEALDDLERRRRDKEANSQRYLILTDKGDTREIPSSSLTVGDVVIIKKDQRVPADCILLRTTESDGACFIRTDQLDGETDWKLRVAVSSCQKLTTHLALFSIGGYVYADKPHKNIHSFMGTFTKPSGQVEGLTVENTLWANTVLAAGSAFGLVIYTGRDTRAVMNTDHPETKLGLLDLEINRLAKILCAFTLALSILMISLNGFRGVWYVYLLRFLILFSSIIPISLRVNLDMGKTFYSRLIMRDSDIPGTIVRTSTIPEELGRVEYLLTDKTGTLTKNDMELKKLHMGTMAFSFDTMDEVASQLAVAFERDHTGKRDMAARVKDVVMALALCHNVTPIHDDTGTTTYQAASPDEVAIVRWTESVGLRLVARDLRSITLQTLAGNRELRFEILEIFPFTSESKRMGILVRDPSGGIMFVQKGADVVMTKIVHYNDWLEEECGNMAREGLRTMVIARKRLSEDSYREFAEKYHTAKISLHDRAEAISKVVAELETELELLGLTGVEDRLQDDVKTTLELLRNAGLKIWMLTGDKVETAACVAVSSKLVARNQHMHLVEKIRNPVEGLEQLDAIRSKGDCCLIVDGESLQLFLEHHCDEFRDLSTRLPVVVCCRCSPTQKADVTRLLKGYARGRVCAIGDGGNDVSMIQTAHVGVGIVGKEGMQAALAADFSITQFSHLTKLLLWHGRNSYKRSAKLSQFVIHRGLIISIMQAVFSSIFYFAPIALYQGLLIVGYSTVFTMAPVFSLVLDKDVNEEIALLYPELYKDLRKGRSLSYKTFFSWLLISVYQGGMIMMLAIWLFPEDFMNIVSISFTALVFNELLMVAFEITTWHRFMVIAEILTLLIYVCSMAWLDNDFDSVFILSFRFFWKLGVIIAVSSLPLYVIKRIRRILAPPSYTKLT